MPLSPATIAQTGKQDPHQIDGLTALLKSGLVAYTVGREGSIHQCSEALRDILGYTSPYQQLDGRAWSHLVSANEQAGLNAFLLQIAQAGGRGQHRCNLQLADGSQMPVVLQGAAVQLTSGLEQVVVVYELGPWIGGLPTGPIDTFQAFDPESGFPSAQLLYDRATIALALARRYRRRAAILRVRLEHLDALTQHASDAQLADIHGIIADTFRHGTRDSDTVAKLGDADFAILLPEIRTQDDAGVLAARLIEALARDLAPSSRGIRLAAAVGVAVYPSDGTDAHALLRIAETAMREAQGSPGGRFGFAGATHLELQSIHPVSVTALESTSSQSLDDDHRQLVADLNQIINQMQSGAPAVALEPMLRACSDRLRHHLVAESAWRAESPFDGAREQHKRDLRFLDELHCILADVTGQSTVLAVHLLREWLVTHLSVSQVLPRHDA